MYSTTAARFPVHALGGLLMLSCLSACNDPPAPAEPPSTDTMPMTQPPLDQAITEPVEQLAVNDLARQLNIAPARIEVISAQAVTWPDGSLGCPEPDRMYTQALVEGFQVVLAAEGEEFHYHAGRNREPFLCPEARRRTPVGTGRAQY